MQRFDQLRAWQACDVYKKAIYRLCALPPFADDWGRRRQLETAVAAPPAHIAEGFGRFNPLDFAKFLDYARASLMESQAHLRDAVDKGYLSDDDRLRLEALAEVAMREVAGLHAYLHSNRAQHNARRARSRRNSNREP